MSNPAPLLSPPFYLLPSLHATTVERLTPDALATSCSVITPDRATSATRDLCADSTLARSAVSATSWTKDTLLPDITHRPWEGQDEPAWSELARWASSASLARG